METDPNDVRSRFTRRRLLVVAGGAPRRRASSRCPAAAATKRRRRTERHTSQTRTSTHRSCAASRTSPRRRRSTASSSRSSPPTRRTTSTRSLRGSSPDRRTTEARGKAASRTTSTASLPSTDLTTRRSMCPSSWTSLVMNSPVPPTMMRRAASPLGNFSDFEIRASVASASCCASSSSFSVGGSLRPSRSVNRPDPRATERAPRMTPSLAAINSVLAPPMSATTT